MKKRIALSLALIFLVAAVVGGGTFAYFTNSATGANETFAAGTVEVEIGSAYTLPVHISNMAPGDMFAGYFNVKNTGSLAHIFSITPQGEGLYAAMNVKYYYASPKLFGYEWKEFTPSSTWITQSGYPLNKISTIKYVAELPWATGNEWQGAAGSVSFLINAEQKDHNPKVSKSGGIGLLSVSEDIVVEAVEVPAAELE